MSGAHIDESFTNLQGFKNATNLVVDNDTYKVYHDPISIKSVQLERFPTVGLEAGFVINFSGIDNPPCSFKWYRVVDGMDILISSLRNYIPTEADIGHTLKLQVFPAGPEETIILENCVETISKDPVLPNQGPFLFEYRFITPPTSEKTRVISYNILASTYTSTEKATTIMYPSCPSFVLNLDYRKRILLKELQYYDGDLYGLQECELSFFESVLYPFFAAKGYDGFLFTKKTTVNEGSATFFRKNRFCLKFSTGMELASCLESHPSCQKLRQDMLTSSELSEIYVNVLLQKTVFQILVLYDTFHNKTVYLLNSHLYYAPEADLIRLVQANILLKYLEWIIKKADFLNHESSNQNNYESSRPSIIMTGDWNSGPSSAAIELILTRRIHYNSQLFSDPNLASTFTSELFFFSSTGFPEFTTYVSCFSGLLDYVFVDGYTYDQECSVFEVPARQLVLKYGSLPAPHVPSDHLPVISDIKYKNEKNILEP